MTTPSDIAQQALDAAGVDHLLGDLQDGTRPARVLLRAYSPCLSQLLRAAPWDFARREMPLTLLGDVTGQTPDVGTMVPSGFMYCYAYPTDCARVRYIPWSPIQNPGVPSDNIQPANPSAPIMTGLNQGSTAGQRIIPARYLVTNDPNYPPEPGQVEVHGVSPQGRLVICTNVQNARCVYTTNVLYPAVWDSLFRGAFVALLASEIVLPLTTDKKFGMAMRAEQIKIAKARIQEARVADGNEGVHSSDLRVDWMQARQVGGPYGGGYAGYGFANGPGIYGCDWAGSCQFGDGSAY